MNNVYAYFHQSRRNQCIFLKLAFSLLFTFCYIHKKKVLDSRIFSTSGFRWIYMFWDVLKTIWPFLEYICLFVFLLVCMSLKFCGHCISRINERKLMKLYMRLQRDIICCWLDLMQIPWEVPMLLDIFNL